MALYALAWCSGWFYWELDWHDWLSVHISVPTEAGDIGHNVLCINLMYVSERRVEIQDIWCFIVEEFERLLRAGVLLRTIFKQFGLASRSSRAFSPSRL
jgi:hypothetical protein